MKWDEHKQRTMERFSTRGLFFFLISLASTPTVCPDVAFRRHTETFIHLHPSVCRNQRDNLLGLMWCLGKSISDSTWHNLCQWTVCLGERPLSFRYNLPLSTTRLRRWARTHSKSWIFCWTLAGGRSKNSFGHRGWPQTPQLHVQVWPFGALSQDKRFLCKNCKILKKKVLGPSFVWKQFFECARALHFASEK